MVNRDSDRPVNSSNGISHAMMSKARPDKQLKALIQGDILLRCKIPKNSEKIVSVYDQGRDQEQKPFFAANTNILVRFEKGDSSESTTGSSPHGYGSVRHNGRSLAGVASTK